MILFLIAFSLWIGLFLIPASVYLSVRMGYRGYWREVSRFNRGDHDGIQQ